MKHLILFALLAIALLTPACKSEEERCIEKLTGDWVSDDFDGPYSDEVEIRLSLDDDGEGSITFVYDDGDSDQYDITEWEVDACEEIDIIDEDGDRINFDIIDLSKDELEVEGTIYGDSYEIRFEKD